MQRDLQEQIEAKIAAFADDVEQRREGWAGVRDPVAFRQMELDLHARARELADQIGAAVVEEIVNDPTFQATSSAAARLAGGYRHGGRRTVKLRLLGGSDTRVRVEYLKRNRRKQPGRRRRSGRRGKGGSGVYPVLAALGIAFGVTPTLAGEVCRQVADSNSVRAARGALDRRGIDLGHKQTLRIVNHFGSRAAEQRSRWLARARENVATRGILRGKRVAVATDGGRLRERRPARQGRRRKETGHRRYDAPWREPKLLTIYVIDEQGRQDKSFRPVYDGTLEDADASFEMILGYLKALGAHEAKELIFLGDGAKWIWKRVDNLVTRLGIDRERVREVIDWAHAVQTLHAMAKERVNWSDAERDRWIRKAKRHLHAGRIDGVLALIDGIARGRRAKAIKEHRDYFDRNRTRMQYAHFVARKIPTGSGAVESAIRQVVNMRLKSNAKFWLEVNAQSMLLLRSYLKAGHFDLLVDWSISQAAPWWPHSSAPTSPLRMKTNA